MNPPANRNATTPPATVSRATIVRFRFRLRFRKASLTEVGSTLVVNFYETLKGIYINKSVPNLWFLQFMGGGYYSYLKGLVGLWQALR